MSVNSRTRERVFERDGYMCVDCGTPYGLSVQHRVNRGMGRSKVPEGMASLVTMCVTHNCLLEADAEYAELGRKYGWKVHRNRIVAPGDVPVFYRPLQKWVYLGDDGSRLIVEAPDEAA